MNLKEGSLDQTFIALADPTRRAILARLNEGEARVTEIAEPFPISLNSVSKHIRLLERAELVKRERVGREHVLSLNPKGLDEVALWIEETKSFWLTRFEALDALLKKRKADST
ncbi:metalloregulator ArsR/SmtB family transcription factor [Mesorhizobium sp. NBSH29]|uniref:ArsR/SmtB family transcription factor n=1 Tax=Mesorhizobium sp. NBSH29 TaxID=2654249 RepID=UPI0018967D8A|nr:metalloregulator ArsR/SmtB family transcription factor [Mesorhizobium sp. NBSH29]QPC86429.1 metalloregulator ArsR/SmtB family transcription factor [Mesorhizobium sp. NBSH29]